MIPKIIHYCWLSNERKPYTIRKCISTWHRFLPEYEFKLWDINSFDYGSVAFTRDALMHKKWAFVSDYIRLYALYHYGGIYLDTDVACYGSLDPLLSNRAFTGLEMRDKDHKEIFLEGAIIGAEKNHPFIEEALKYYDARSFIQSDGSLDLTPIPTILSNLALQKYDWIREDATQNLEEGFTVFSTKTIANSNCARGKTVLLYHLNNRSWMETSRIQSFLRSAKRILKHL